MDCSSLVSSSVGHRLDIFLEGRATDLCGAPAVVLSRVWLTRVLSFSCTSRLQKWYAPARRSRLCTLL